jgi:hypothetical protein
MKIKTEQSAATFFEQPLRSVIEGAEYDLVHTRFASTSDYELDSNGITHL